MDNDSPDVPLPNENTRVMDALGETQFEDLGLETALQEVFGLETQHEIELHASLFEHTCPHQPTEEGVTWIVKN